ncbi:MAG: hypothetical protein JWR74_1868 [Polaromonas sp.]|jgi:hypothetical protein|nr:hypothetical protein [Polaromonas sp.]
MMPRIVAAETLDSLDENDPAAIRSRRDLQRIHRFMGTRGILVRALQGAVAASQGPKPLRILELGAGDGSLMLAVAGMLASHWPPVDITLLDRQNLVTRQTLDGYARLGWTARPQVNDVFDWAGVQPRHGSDAVQPWDVIVASLFLHHFEAPLLGALLAAIESRTRCFFACEPRRASLALAGSHLVGAIGANAVTREDAVLSVHAGFRDQELGALWPGLRSGWTTRDYAAGLFSHCFLARRRVPANAGSLP